MEKKVALPEPPAVKLPTLRNLSSEDVSSSELLPGEKAVVPVVIITEDDSIHTSVLSTLEGRKTTALSCDIGWVYSGHIGPVCLVLIDSSDSRGVRIQRVLQTLEPKAVFVLGFCHELQDKYVAGDIFICNEVHTNDGIQSCNKGLVKLVKMKKNGWNPPGPRDQNVHTGSAQCTRNGNDAQMQHTGDVEMHFSSTVEVFTLLKNGSIPWTAVCGVIPCDEGEQSSRTLQGWKSYNAEVIATFMAKVFETDDIFKVLDPSESEKRMKSLRLSKPSEESSIDSQNKVFVAISETMDAKRDARRQSRKPELPSKYIVLPDIGAAPAQANELRLTVRSEVLDVLSSIRATSQQDNEAMPGTGDIPQKKAIQRTEYDVTGVRQLADICLPRTTAHQPERQETTDETSSDRKPQATRMANCCQTTDTSSEDRPHQEGEMAAAEIYNKRPGASAKDYSNQGVDSARGSAEVTNSLSPEVARPLSPEVLFVGSNSNDKLSSRKRSQVVILEGSPAFDYNLAGAASASEQVTTEARGTTVRLDIPMETAVRHGSVDLVAPSLLVNRAIQCKGSSLAVQPRSPPGHPMRPRSVSMGARVKMSLRSDEQSTASFSPIKKP